MGKLNGSKKLTLISALAISILWGAAAHGAVNPPLLPAAYYGNITSSDGSHVEEGIVEGAIDGVVRGELKAEDDKFGGPGLDDKLVITGSESDKGKEIQFKVDGIQAESKGVIWSSGDVEAVQLTIPYTFSAITAGGSLNLKVGESSQLKVEALYSNGQKSTLTSNLKYKSSKEGIVNINSLGKVTAVAEGTADIVISYRYGKETKIKVTVTKASGSGTGSAISNPVNSTGIKDQVDKIINQLTGGNTDPVKAVEQISQIINKQDSDHITDGDLNSIKTAIKTVLEKVGELPLTNVTITNTAGGQRVTVNETTLVERIEQLGNIRQNLLDTISKTNLEDLKSVVKPSVVITSPQGINVSDGLALNISQNAANMAVEKNVGLTFKSEDIIFDLPSEVIKSLSNLTDDMVNLEISAGRISEKLEVPDDAKLVGDPLDLNIAAQDEQGLEFKPASYNTKVTITFALKGADLSQIDTRKLGVYRQVDKYNQVSGQTEKVWEYVGGRISEDGKSIIFETDHTSIYGVMESKVTFTDIQKHWAKDTIEVLTARHIAKGLAKDQFGPEAHVTRAQFTALVLRALGIDEKASSSRSFVDVNPDAWYYSAIETTYREGLADGVGNGKFAPDQSISRQEMAVFISRALKKAGNQETVNTDQAQTLLSVFRDKDSIALWSEQSVAKAVKLGIIAGRTKDTFIGKANATRAESVVMIYRMLEVLGQLN